MDYQKLVQKRRELSIEGYFGLANVGMDGDWISPSQISSCSNDGPVILGYNWLDANSSTDNHTVLRQLGYLPGMPFNRVLEIALASLRLHRSSLYITQAFHLLPLRRSQAIPAAAIDVSFDEVTKHELADRRVISLGVAATAACRRHGVECLPVYHPSARRISYNEKATRLARAIAAAMS